MAGLIDYSLRKRMETHFHEVIAAIFVEDLVGLNSEQESKPNVEQTAGLYVEQAKPNSIQ